MKKSDLKVLIVDDDPTVASATLQAVERAGFAGRSFAHPEEALQSCHATVYQAAIIDCMLPKMHGVDLAQAIRKEGSGEHCILLTSGVFKDKAFIREALSKTSARDFLVKPYDLNQLLTLLDETLGDLIEADRDPIFDLLAKPTASPREVRKALENIETLDGNHLPYLYSLLLDSEVNGHLNIVGDNDTVSGISFSNGQIIHVDVPDKKTFLGVLLVESGFLSASELQAIVAIPNERRIGERLIDSNVLSPHALPIILSQQMLLRLGLTISSQPARVNFVQEDLVSTNPSIDNSEFTIFLHEWLFSKIKLSWIQSFYTLWLDHIPQQGPFFNKLSNFTGLPVFAKLPDFASFLLSNRTLSQLIEQQKYPEDMFYRALHLLMIRRVIAFDSKKQVADMKEHASRLQRLADKMKGKNDIEMFELLGVSRRAKPTEIQKAYRDFSKIYHPDLAEQNFPPELKLVAKEVYVNISRAYKLLTDDSAKEKFLKELSQNESKKHFEAEAVFEEGRSLLHRNILDAALEKFEACCQMIEPTPEMLLHRIWARLKLAESTGTGAQLAATIQAEMTSIPPEDRHHATYFFVKGLFEKSLSNTDLARRNFEQAAAIDPNFREAKREFNIMRLQGNQKPQNVLNADLKDVFGLLFKKKVR